MKRLAWLTDIHLNFVDQPTVDALLARLNATAADAIVLSGDTSEAPQLLGYLDQIDRGVQAPVYFVLGNHDYYFGSIADVRRQVAAFCRQRPKLVWLAGAGVVPLTDQTALVGHDGWADALLGDYERSYVMMNDYRLIAELAAHSKADRWPLLRALGEEAAAHFRRHLPEALDRYGHVIAVTHVPPFREACTYQGEVSNDEWAPHFTCHAVGQVLREMMHSRPDRRLTVLCGHSHDRAEVRILDNLLVRTGGAEYGSPEIQDVVEVA